MATERILIEVTSRGAAVVRRQLDDIGGASKRSASSVDLLKRALAAIGGAAALRELVKLADTYTTLQNRLRLVTTGTQNLATVTDELTASANRTRQSLESTVELYSRIARASDQLGLSQRELLDITETINKAVVVSGATAREASAGLIQFAQGLAAGALRGDELRSVLEQMPRLARAIADGLGITVGQLRELGGEGKLTAEQVLGAIQSQAKVIEEEFSRIAPTVESALTVLRNAMVTFIGELDTGQGASAALARGILALADSFDILAKAAGVAGTTMLVAFGGPALIRGLAAATAGVRALTVAMAANPIGAIVVALTAAVSAMYFFGDQVNVTDDGLVNLRDVALATFQIIAEGATTAAQFLGENFAGALDYAKEAVGAVGAALGSLVGIVRSTVNAQIGLWVGAYRAIVGVFSLIPDALEDLFTQGMNRAIDVVQTAIDTIVDSLNKLSFIDIDVITLPKLEAKTEGAAAQAAAIISEAFSGALAQDYIGDAVGTVIDEVMRRAREIAEARRAEIESQLPPELNAGGENKSGQGKALERSKALAEVNAELEEELRLAGLLGPERETQTALLKIEQQLKRELKDDTFALTQAERDSLTVKLESIQAQENITQALENILAPAEEYKQALLALNALQNDARVSAEQLAIAYDEARVAFLDTQRDMESGFERGFLKLKDEMGDLATLAERTVTNSFKSMEDALVEFTTKGKIDFRSLIDSILADIARLYIRQAVTGPLLKLLGNFDLFGGGQIGGGISGGIPLPMLAAEGAASGGRVIAPGGPTDDGGLFRLSNGEFVVNSMAARTYAPVLDAINSFSGSISTTRAPVPLPSSVAPGRGGGGGSVIQIIDQRGANAAPIETENRGTTSDGQQVIAITVRDVVTRSIKRGDFDSSMRERYGSSPQLVRRG